MVPSLLEKHKGTIFLTLLQFIHSAEQALFKVFGNSTIMCVCYEMWGRESKQEEGICVAMWSALTLFKGKVVRSRGWRMVGGTGRHPAKKLAITDYVP